MPSYYITKKKSDDEISEETKRALHPDMLKNITKKVYKIEVTLEEIDDLGWEGIIIDFLKDKKIKDIGGFYQVFIRNPNRQYGDEFGDMIWDGDIEEGWF